MANMNRTNVLWLSDQPAATMYTGYMGTATMPGWAATNSTSAKVVRLRNSREASAALAFASKYNIEIAVKSTGHSWFGRSTEPGSLLLWTHLMKEIRWEGDDFVPRGCTEPVVGAVTLGAGVQFWEVYLEAQERRRIFTGGTCGTVGHVGFTLGGGYGDYSRMYGSAATNLVEAEVVLADGRVLTLNRCGPHADLFSVLRGGGSAPALVVSATYRTYPWPEGGTIGTISGNVSTTSFLAWYSSITRQGLSRHFGGTADASQDGNVSVSMAYNGLRLTACKRLVRPLGLRCFRQGYKVWPPKGAINRRGQKIDECEDAGKACYGDGWHNDWEQPLGYVVGSLSRYFSLEDLEGERLQHFADTVTHMVEIAPFGGYITIALNYALGHGSEIATRYTNQTMVHPQAYSAIGTLKLLSGHWNNQPGDQFLPNSSTQISRSIANAVKKVDEALQSLLPESSGYFNENAPDSASWQYEQWDEGYATISQVSLRYDPEGLFSCHSCVGGPIVTDERKPCVPPDCDMY
eukprot:TRINITY_DN72954_c0_g1_i1.p1 TRINITY_DN72954_c0_g1~~TRINITY_DN72954_c0_g1_i1.p1  ORF type:complete len:606 (-),score=36.41 TRINITY_DN72954_c0_g1_i1:191-1750(-)